MDDPTENEISSFKRFLETFCFEVKEPSRGENDSSVRRVSYMVEPSEIEGESLLWALDYLCQTHQCPHGLSEQVSREAFKRATQNDLQHYFDNGKVDSSQSSPAQRVELQQLHLVVEWHVYKVCVEWNKQLPSFLRPSRRLLPVSVHAIKNTRRRMEDRHVILPDLNTLFQLQDSPSQSYYAVFDGHGGPEAAMFCASQLHVNLVRDPYFNSNPALALTRAYAATDRQFLKKAEEQKLRSGTTGVNLLIKGDNCFVSWLGDSQVMLVKDGHAVTLMEAHKPNREDERKRIEELGGSVTNNFGGVWRVNGNVSVSRAVGDASMKPFLSSEADVTSFMLEGKEDYVVLGCDGVWDVMQPHDVPLLVHSYLHQNPNQHSSVAKHLVAKAKELGSGDNISCIVVFFRTDISEPAGVMQLDSFQILHRENGDHKEVESSSELSGSHLGSGASTTSSSTSGLTGMSKLTLNNSNMGDSVVDGEAHSPGGSQWASFRRGQGHQLHGDFPKRLERQTGFFIPTQRLLRTGHSRQQLDPLDVAERAGSSRRPSHGSIKFDTSSIKADQHSHLLKPKPLSKGSSRSNNTKPRGGSRRKPRARRRRAGNSLRSGSEDSSLGGSSKGHSGQSTDFLSLSSSLPSHALESLAKHVSLAEILQQMPEPVDENINPNASSSQGFLSVRGTPAQLHESLPRIPSSLLHTTTTMTPVSTSRRSILHAPDYLGVPPHAKGKNPRHHDT